MALSVAQARSSLAESPVQPESRWGLVAATFWIQLITVGSCFYAFSALLVPISEGLGASRFEVSLAITAQVGVTTLCGAIAGRLLGAGVPVAWVMRGGLVLVTGALLGAASANNHVVLIVWVGVVAAVGMAGLGPIPCNTVLIHAFDKNRGKALGFSALGATLGGTVFLPVVSWLELQLEWRATLVTLAVLALAALGPAVLFLRTGRLAAVKGEEAWGTSVRTYLRQRAFWLLLGLLALNIASIVPVIQLFHSHVTDLTGSVATAATASALLTFFGAFAKPVAGFLSDNVGIKRCIGACIIFEVVGVLLINRYLGVEWLMAGAILFGIGYGGLGPLFAMLVPRVYDEAQFPTVIGYIGAICFPLNMLGLPFATWVYQQTGGYGIAFGAFAVCFVLSAVLLCMVKIRESSCE